jgi:hypothetical protein
MFDIILTAALCLIALEFFYNYYKFKNKRKYENNTRIPFKQ